MPKVLKWGEMASFHLHQCSVIQGEWLITLYSWHQIRQGLWSQLDFYNFTVLYIIRALCEIGCIQLLIITSHAMHENTKSHHKQKSETMNLINLMNLTYIDGHVSH